MSVTHSDITSHFSTFPVCCGDKYVSPNMSDFQSTLYDSGSAACSICRQDRGNEESTVAGSSFSPATTLVGTTEAWVISTTLKLPFPIEGLVDSEGGGRKPVRCSPSMEEMDSSNSSSFELMPTENRSVGKEDRLPHL